jgi:hypothetical protein
VGKLVLIESENAVETKILLNRRPRNLLKEVTSRRTLIQIVSAFDEEVAECSPAKRAEMAKTIIGGAPVTQSYADEIGADGYAVEAGTGVELAKKLISAAKK